jgi:hypothetical protein
MEIRRNNMNEPAQFWGIEDISDSEILSNLDKLLSRIKHKGGSYYQPLLDTKYKTWVILLRWDYNLRSVVGKIGFRHKLNFEGEYGEFITVRFVDEDDKLIYDIETPINNLDDARQLLDKWNNIKGKIVEEKSYYGINSYYGVVNRKE